MSPVRKLIGIVTLGPALCFGCYETKATSLRVQTPNAQQLDCFQTADRVFEDEGFVAAPTVAGVHRLYTPNASTRNGFALRWGIAVSIAGDHDIGGWGQCTFDLEVLSPDATCGLNCPLTPQPGYGDVTRKMAGLLSAAFKARQPDGD